MSPEPPMLREALRLCAAGLAVHWLRGPFGGPERGRGKAPVHKRWNERRALGPDELIREYRVGYNLGLHTGLVTGARLPIVTVDSDAPEAFDFARSRVAIVSAVRSQTRQGEHWHYRHPGAGIRVLTRERYEGQGLEILGDCETGKGSNVVLPPSVHKTGFVYQEIGGPWTEEALTHLPVYDPAWFPMQAPAKPIECQREVTDDLLLKRAAAYLEKYPLDEENGYGTWTYKAAICMVRGFAIPRDTAYFLMAKHYNPRLPKPWPERLLMRKVDQALNSQRATAPVLRDAPR